MSVGFGIDVGASTVSVAAIKKGSGGISLEYFRSYPREELDGGEDDLERLARELASRLAADGYRAKRCVLGVSGRDAIMRYTHMPPMPEWRLALLMQFEIEENVDRIGEPLSSDFRALPNAGGGGNLVLVALAKDARVKETVDAFEAAGFEVAGAVPQPVATGDAYRFLGDEPEREITAVVEVGQTSTEIALIEEGELIFARSVSQGGDLFTERLQKSLRVSYDEAEAIKRSGEAPAGKDLAKLLRTPCSQLASTVRATVDFARRQLKRRNLEVGRVALTGGGGQVIGLAEELASEVGCEVEVFEAFSFVERGSRCDAATIEAAETAGFEGATAAGLALSSVVPGATKLDLLPLSVKERLHFRHRTLWMYVAAAALAAAVLISLVLALWESSGETGRSGGLKSARAEVEGRLGEHLERKEKNDQREQDLRRLAERARPGFHLSNLLARLGEVTPSQISFNEAGLVNDEDVEGAFRFELVGLADDSQQQGGAAMATLKEELERDPKIESVNIQPEGDEGHSRRFRLTVVPAGNPAPVVEKEEN